MYAHKLYDLEVSRETVQEFRGYNHNLRIGDNEFFDMKNLTGKYYPVLSPRGRRGIVREADSLNGLLSRDELCVIENNTLRYGDFFMELDSSVSGERQLVSMGAYIIVFPDMMYVNTSDTSDNGNISAGKVVYDSADKSINLSVCNADGEDISAMYITASGWASRIGSAARERYLNDLVASGAITSDEKNFYYVGCVGKDIRGSQITLPFGGLFGAEADYTIGDRSIVSPADGAISFDGTLLQCRAPGKTTVTAEFTDGSSQVYTVEVMSLESPRDGDHWFKCSSRALEAYVYSDELKKWVAVDTYVKITASGIGGFFSKGGSCRFRMNTSSSLGSDILFNLYKEYTYVSPVKYDTDWIVIPGGVFMSDISDIDGTLTLDFSLPKMDFIVESGNRLWGCRYGKNNDGNFVNEIYASELGNFRSFYSFRGISADSYTVSLGSGGVFTGAANLGGNPIFFKENFCHVIYGSYPSSYQLHTEVGTWVASGSHKSVCVDEGVLYFHGKDGVYAYDGASKQMISEALGTERYGNAVGGCIGGKYYISMADGSGGYTLFVFDRGSGMWHREDNTRARFFAAYGGDLFFVDGDRRLVTVNGSVGVSEGAVEWYAESGRIGFAAPDSRYIGKIQLKMSIPVGSRLKVYIQYDSDGYWEFMGAIEGKNASSFTLPIMPRKCDHFSFKLCGVGDCKIFSITKTYEIGGEA